MTGDGGTKEARQTWVWVYDKKFLLPAESADYFTKKKLVFAWLDWTAGVQLLFYLFLIRSIINCSRSNVENKKISTQLAVSRLLLFSLFLSTYTAVTNGRSWGSWTCGTAIEYDCAQQQQTHFRILFYPPIDWKNVSDSFHQEIFN